VAANESGSATTKSLVRIDDGNAAAAKPAGISNAPRITARLQDVRVQEGQPLKLYCKIEGDPLPEITWFKDGEKVAPSDRLVLEQDPDGSARLIIPSCTLNDDGIYRVIATNPHGSANDKCTATVRKAPLAAGTGGPDTDFDANKTPRVLVPLENVRVPEKERFKLTCRFGPPEPKLTIKWFKDGDRVYAYDNLKLEELPDGTCELTVLSAKKSDAGSYRCLAENAFGQTRTSGEVTVVAKEKKPVNIEDQQKEGGLAPGFKIVGDIRPSSF
jgi:myosin-light-chain kinase